MLVCLKCQTENNDDVKFCKECGDKLIKEVENEPSHQDPDEFPQKQNELAGNAIATVTKKSGSLESFLGNIPKKIFKAIKNLVFNIKTWPKRKSFKLFIKTLIICAISIAIIVALLFIALKVVFPRYNYSRADQAFEAGQYETAIQYYEAAENYFDSADKILFTIKAKHYVDGIKAFDSKDFSVAIIELIAAEDYPEASNKLYEVAMAAFDKKQFDNAVTAFAALPDIKDETYKHYSYAMNDFARKKYKAALINFEKAGLLMDAPTMIYACNFMIAEELWSKNSYDDAQKIYLNLPNEFEYNGIAVSNRLNALKLYNSIKSLEGSYNVVSGNYEVRQIHNRTGIWYNWTNLEKGYGDLEITIIINENGTINFSGIATGYRYTAYSAIAAGVSESPYTASFSKDLSSATIPTVLFSDDTTILKYAGGSKFTLSYARTDRNKDVYFRYVYTSNYTFSK